MLPAEANLQSFPEISVFGRAGACEPVEPAEFADLLRDRLPFFPFPFAASAFEGVFGGGGAGGCFTGWAGCLPVPAAAPRPPFDWPFGPEWSNEHLSPYLQYPFCHPKHGALAFGGGPPVVEPPSPFPRPPPFLPFLPPLPT